MAVDEGPPWEPPIAGTEVEHVLGALDRLRTTFRWKADGLDDAALRVRIASSALTLGGLLKHLALVEDHVSTTRLDGSSIGEPWESTWQSDDWVFTSASEQPAGDLYPTTAPEHEQQWHDLVRLFLDGARAAAALGQTPERLAAEVEPGLTLHDELNSVAVHNAYHLGKIVALRQRMGAWPPAAAPDEP